MSEPYNDEEQKEETMFLDWVKNNWKTEYEKGDNFKRLWEFADRLIATVEQRKANIDVLRPLISRDNKIILELEEQNAKLTAELEAALKRIEEMEGINHKWKN